MTSLCVTITWSWSFFILAENKLHQYTVYYESLKRDLKTKPINECRYDERLQTRVEESTRLVCPRLVEELEHLKIETRLIDEMFCECDG